MQYDKFVGHVGCVEVEEEMAMKQWANHDDGLQVDLKYLSNHH
jgi:hypothetical protein